MPDIQKLSLNPSFAILAAGVLVAAAIVYVNANPAAPVMGADSLPAPVDVPAPRAGDHVRGNPSAPIVLIEYSDFECYYCMQVYPTLKRLVDESGGEVAWIMRNFPLESIHPQARGAALAAECIAAELGDEGYWRYADAVFANQEQLSPAYSRQLALLFGAKEATYDSCVANATYSERVDAETGDALMAGGQGTPFTVVWSEGYQAPVSGALPYEQFKSVISSVQARQ